MIPAVLCGCVMHLWMMRLEVIQGRRIDTVTHSDSGGVTPSIRPCHSWERSTDRLTRFVSLSQHHRGEEGATPGSDLARPGPTWLGTTGVTKKKKGTRTGGGVRVTEGEEKREGKGGAKGRV